MMGVIPSGKTHKYINLFGYTTRGIPGLEIVGMGKNSRTVKEKLIFLTRQQNNSIPLNRFVLSIDPVSRVEKEDDFNWLELPLLILYWSLLNWIPLKNLENCFTSGRVFPGGAIVPWAPSQLKKVGEIDSRIWITSKWMLSPSGFFKLPLEELISSRQAVYIPEKNQIERAFAKST